MARIALKKPERNRCRSRSYIWQPVHLATRTSGNPCLPRRPRSAGRQCRYPGASERPAMAGNHPGRTGPHPRPGAPRPGAPRTGILIEPLRRRWAGSFRPSLVETKARCFKGCGEPAMARDIDRQVAALPVRAAILIRCSGPGTPQTRCVGSVCQTEGKTRPLVALCTKALSCDTWFSPHHSSRQLTEASNQCNSSIWLNDTIPPP